MGTGELEHELLLAETELNDREAEGESGAEVEALRAKVATLRQRLALAAPVQGGLRSLSVGTWVPLPMYAEPPLAGPTVASPEVLAGQRDASVGPEAGDEVVSARIRAILLDPELSNSVKSVRLIELRKGRSLNAGPERLLSGAFASVGAAEGLYAHLAPLPAVDPPMLAAQSMVTSLDELPSAGDGLTRTERLALESLRDVAPAARPLRDLETIARNVDSQPERLALGELQAGLVRLSQAARALVPLVEVDATPPSRARLTHDGEAFLAGRLALPLLLIDGFEGRTTRIPPHHPGELLRAACYVLVRSGLRPRVGPRDDVRNLLDAGTLIGPELGHPGVLRRGGIWELWKLWARGHGVLLVEAGIAEEYEHAGVRARLVITEFPEPGLVGVFLSELEARRDHGDFPGLTEVRDESTEREGRVVLTLEDVCFLGMTRRRLERAQLLLWRRACDFTVLDERGTPRRLSLDELLEAHLRWRRDVFTRQRGQKLAGLVHAEAEAETLYVALLLREPVLQALRAAASDDEAIEALTQFMTPAHRATLAALPFSPSHDYARGFTPWQARVVAQTRRLQTRSLADALAEWERARGATAEARSALESNDAAIDALLEELREVERRFAGASRRTLVRGD